MEIILVSHGKLATGMKDTVEMIAGKQSNLTAIEAYGDGSANDDDFIDKVKKIITDTKEENIVVVTDVLGGSVNNEMTRLLQDNPEINLLTGMNFPLIITLVTQGDQAVTKGVDEVLKEGKKGILSVNKLMQENKDDEELL